MVSFVVARATSYAKLVNLNDNSIPLVNNCLLDICIWNTKI
jgi:hypothetical protein